MEIQILKRETIGSGPNAFTESEVVAKYEIMDGAPVRGESIPIRLFLHSYGLSPTMRDIHRKFSIRYFLNLVLLDEEDRRYYKQQEITLYRKSDRRRKIMPKGAGDSISTDVRTGSGDHMNTNLCEQTQKDPHVKPVEESPTKQFLPEVQPNLGESSNQIETVTKDLIEESSATKINGTDPIVANENDIESPSQETDSCDSYSPDVRSARSMHRYQSKQSEKSDTADLTNSVSHLTLDQSTVDTAATTAFTTTTTTTTATATVTSTTPTPVSNENDTESSKVLDQESSA